MGLSSKQRKWTWAIFGIFKSFVTFHEHGESSIETFGFWLWIIHQFLIGWCVSGIRWARSLQFLLIPHEHFERTIEAFLFDSPYTISYPFSLRILFKNRYSTLYQYLLVLQCRSSAKNLSKVVWFFFVKRGLRGGNFLDISDEFYWQKLCYICRVFLLD